MMHQYFSHFLVVKFTSNAFFFMVWRLEVLWYLEGSGLIMLTCMFMYMMVLVEAIVMMKVISKVSDDNKSDHV